MSALCVCCVYVHPSSQAAVLNGRIYLIGGLDEMRSRLSQVESLDPREGRWQAVTPLTSARSSAGVAALQVCVHGRTDAHTTHPLSAHLGTPCLSGTLRGD